MNDRNSKYDPLGSFLAQLDEREVSFSLTEISALVGGLPPEAYRHQFWANVANHHDARRKQWLDNGYRAFFDKSQSSVRFTKDSVEDVGRSDSPWSDQELRACVVAYRKLWEAEQLGENLNKSQLRREALSAELSGRAKGSYEFRMQNISALLHELGIPFVRGYLPRKNVGGVKPRLVSIINDVWGRNTVSEAPTADPDAFATRLMSALEKFQAGDRSAPTGTANAPRSAYATSRFIRDPEVVAWVLMRAAGRCEACEEPAPFFRGDGTPFLEVHHLRPLAEGGPDVVENTIAACPNCHRRLHHGADRVELRRAILRSASGLKDFPKSPIVQTI